jgi:hypothetical protein
LGEKNTEKPHPEIISMEEKEIKEQKPPNNKIIDFNIVENKTEKEM